MHVMATTKLLCQYHLLVDQCGHREAIEAVCECLPQADVVPPLALIIESVDAVDGGTLMVASQQEEVFGILDLRHKAA